MADGQNSLMNSYTTPKLWKDFKARFAKLCNGDYREKTRIAVVICYIHTYPMFQVPLYFLHTPGLDPHDQQSKVPHELSPFSFRLRDLPFKCNHILQFFTLEISWNIYEISSNGTTGYEHRERFDANRSWSFMEGRIRFVFCSLVRWCERQIPCRQTSWLSSQHDSQKSVNQCFFQAANSAYTHIAFGASVQMSQFTHPEKENRGRRNSTFSPINSGRLVRKHPVTPWELADVLEFYCRYQRRLVQDCLND